MVEAEHIIANAIFGAMRLHAQDNSSDAIDDDWLTPFVSQHIAQIVLKDLERRGWSISPNDLNGVAILKKPQVEFDVQPIYRFDDSAAV